MTKREWAFEVGEGVVLGIILFFGAVFSLMLNRDIVHMELFAEKLFLIMGGYVLAVLAIKVIFSISFIRKAAVIFQGAGIIWWIWLLGLGVTVASSFIPKYIRYIVLVDVVVLSCYCIGQFLHTKWIAKELNGGKWKKGLDYEVLHYGIPARIKMDGVQYLVQITEYCSLTSGVVPAIEFKQV